MPNLPYSPDVGQNSDGGISNFRTSDDIDMKLGAVTKPDKKNKTMSKKNNDDAISENCDVIVIFPFTANLEQSQSRISDA